MAVDVKNASGRRVDAVARIGARRTLWGLLVVACAAVLSGCVSYTTVLVDSETGMRQTCESTGWGLSGARRAAFERAACVETLKSLGYRPSNELAGLASKSGGDAIPPSP